MDETKNQTALTPEQEELVAAQERLTAAKAKVELANKLKMEKALANAAALRAAEEKRLFEQQEEIRRIEALHAERKRKQQEAEEAERQRQLAEHRRLEAEVTKQEAEARQRTEHEAKVTRLAEEAFRAEQEAQRIEQELIREAVVLEESEPPTLVDIPVLGIIFGRAAVSVPAHPTQGPVVEQQKAPEGYVNPFPSSQDIELIQTAWSKKTGGYRPNQLVTERLLQRFPTDAIIRALEKVAEAQKARAVGVDGQLALAEQLLQEAATT